MIQTHTGRGRPLGSKDHQPREKRTKIQHIVDQYIGHTKGGRKTMHVEVQHPCDKCGSCLKVKFTHSNEPRQSPPDFVRHALAKSLQSNVTP